MSSERQNSASTDTQPIDRDDRIESYTETVKDNLGLLKTTGGRTIKTDLSENNIDYENITELDRVGHITSPVEVFRYQGQSVDGDIYVAEYTARAGIDEVRTISFQFDHKPDTGDIITAELLRELSLKFSEFGDADAEFDCWECGQHTHILDSDFDSDRSKLRQVMDMATEHYCGC